MGRLSLRSLPGIDLLHRWENGPGGIRTPLGAPYIVPFAMCGFLRERTVSEITFNNSIWLVL